MSKDSEEMNEMLTDVVLTPLVEQLRTAAAHKITKEYEILTATIKDIIFRSNYARLYKPRLRFGLYDFIDVIKGNRPIATREAVEGYVMQVIYEIAGMKLDEVLNDQKGVDIPREETKESDSKKDK